MADKQADVDKLTSEIEQDLEMVQSAPVKPLGKFSNYKHGGRTYEFYKSVPWPEWWDEYNTDLDIKTGRLRWKTVNQFIRAKAKLEWQRELLWEMIGPEPQLDGNKHQLRVPYLGDWEKRRKNGFWCFEDHGKVKMVQEAIREKREALEATRALAPLIIARMARWKKIAEVVDARCQEIVFSEKAVTPTEAKKLAFYLRMQEKVERVLRALDDQWMRIFGVNPNDPGAQLLNMAALAGKIGAAAALTGAAANGNGNGKRTTLIQDGKEYELPEDVSPQSIQMAQFLKGHEETYNLPLPEEVQKQQRPKTRQTQ